MADDVVDPTGEAAAGTMEGEGPGTKSDQNGSSLKKAPVVQSNTTPAWQRAPLIQSTQSGVATTFGDEGDQQRYAEAKAAGKSEEEANEVGDSGVGSPALGGIATSNVFGVAIPQEELERLYGDDYAAWRKARAVVTYNGQQYIVPIVDLGPGQKARSRGVVTDFSAAFNQALGAGGYDQAQISLISNAGPDYEMDPQGWYAEQKRIGARFGADRQPAWMRAGTVGGDQKNGSALGRAPVVSQEKKPGEEQTSLQRAPLATSHQAAQSSGGNLGDSFKKIWDVALAAYAKAKLGAEQEESQLKQPLGSDPWEQRIKEIQADPSMSEQDRAAAIADTRRLQQEHQAKVAADVPKAQSGLEAAKAVVEKDKPSPFEQAVGGAIPYFTASVGGGPMGPLLAAQQASAEMYADTLETATQQLKKLHPEWSDSKVMTQAIQAAGDAARGSGQSMLALSLFPEIKVAGPLVARIVQKIGIGAASMEIANVYAQVQRNLALKRSVNPEQDVLEGLRDLDFHLNNLIAGGAFTLPHAGVEIFRPSIKPIEERIKQAQKMDEGLKKEAEVKPGADATHVEENGQSATVEHEKEPQKETPKPAPEPVKEEPVAKEPERDTKTAESKRDVKQTRWQDLTPDERDDITREWRDRFEKAFAPFKRFFDALGVTRTSFPGAGTSVTISPSGEIHLAVDSFGNARDHHENFRRYGVDWRDPNFFRKQIIHELIHAAWFNAQKTRWEQQGRPGTLTDFATRESKQIIKDIGAAADDARAKGNHELANALAEGIKASSDLYSFDKTSAMHPVQRAAEAVRQIVELRTSGKLSEDFYGDSVYQKALSHLKNFFTVARDRIVALARAAAGRDPSGIQSLRDAINETEKSLASIDFLQERPEPAGEQVETGAVRPSIFPDPNPVASKLRQLGLEDTPQARAIAERAIKADSGKEALLVPAMRTKDGRILVSELGHDAAAKKSGEPRETMESGYLTNKGRFATSPMDLARQIEEGGGELRVGAVGQGLRGEEHFLPIREVLERLPHTGELLGKLDDFRASEGELHGRLAQLTHLYKTLTKRHSDLSKEVDAIGKYVEKNGKLPATMSPEAVVWLSHANNGLYREIGDRMKAGGFEVITSKGKRRPFIGAPTGVTPFGRILRPDVRELLGGKITDAAGNLTPEALKLGQEGVREGFFKTPEEIKNWANQYRLEEPQGPQITNLERAREVKYPSFFYTYSPEAMLDRLYWQASEISRLEHFGQKIGDQKDLFDKTVEKINADTSISKAERQRAIESIKALADSIYGRVRHTEGVRSLRSLSSAALAGSPHTSTKIGLSMLFNVPAFRGIGRTFYGMLHTLIHTPEAFRELRRLGLKQDSPVNMMYDPYSITTVRNWIQQFSTGWLKWAGHQLAQDIGKSVTMTASKLWLKDAIKTLQDDPTLSKSRTRQIAEDIQRRGVDPKVFMGPSVDPKLIDRFVREDVQDLQTAYRPEDYPHWQRSGWGSISFQFGHWAYNGARLIIRDIVNPMLQAADRGDVLLSGRYAMRLVGMTFAAAGAAESWRQLDKLFGRQEHVSTIGEIWQAFIRQEPGAAYLATSRLAQDIVGSSVIGVFGDLYQAAEGIGRGTIDTTHFFNPFQPAGVGFLKIFVDAVNLFARQKGKLSDAQISHFAGQLGSIAKGYYDLVEPELAHVGVDLPGHTEAEARRENAFVKSRLELFFDMNPEYATTRIVTGTTPHTGYLQNISERALSGNVQGLKDEIHRYNVEQIETNKKYKTKQEANKALKTSVEDTLRAHRPIPGGKTGEAFRAWASKYLPADEWNRIEAIDRQYMKTVHEAGIPLKE